MPYIRRGYYIVDFLMKEKVPFIFGFCGHGNVGILDALYDRKDEIRLIFLSSPFVMYHSLKGFLAPAASYLGPNAGGCDCTVSARFR